MTAHELPELPDDLPLLPFSEFEMRRLPPVDRKIFFRRSEFTHALVDDLGRTLMVVGITKPTLAHRPELWVLICDAFRESLRTNLRETQRLLQELIAVYPDVEVRVDAEAPLGVKFTQFFGFQEHRREEMHGREYIWLRIK